ncbi:2-polyprenyl-6-methoxyphenol hydroxylase-like oxidoreductase [Saccharothrix sp. NPDC042600]|uniref:FAD-dependent oxidoreductase n=1 Tax=Saccharothrix TaxID=2071 RepID=UPI0033EAF1A6|nr:FAD-dependent oxidoreductase [Saccharothrix mutabilis subsp. capreolus]
MGDAMRGGGRAVVLGASMGGLLAARVLSEVFDEVTVVERDPLDGPAGHRRGVPHGRHTHALLPSGSTALEELFPGLLSGLAEGGTKVIEDYTEMVFSVRGTRLPPGSGFGRPLYLPSRPHLEHRVRERVRALPNVRFLDRTDAAGLVLDAAGEAVTGVRVVPADPGGAHRVLPAACVVDAMGRAARTPAWLDGLGFPRPAEEVVPIHLGYASTPLRLRPGAVPEKLLLLGGSADRPTGMALIAYEHDTWLFTAAGYRPHLPPSDLAGMLRFVEGFAPRHVLDALHAAEPLAPPATFRYHANRRRRYDRLRRFPRGLLVFGDAMCSFNPIYGQGMTVAALQALELRECLRDGADDLARRFFRAAAKPIDVAWRMAVGGDLALPQVQGPRSLPVRLTNAYVDRLLGAARHDRSVADRFIRVSAFLEKPSALVRPWLLCKALTGNRRG